jgi:hypothetical protein
MNVSDYLARIQSLIETYGNDLVFPAVGTFAGATFKGVIETPNNVMKRHYPEDIVDPRTPESTYFRVEGAANGVVRNGYAFTFAGKGYKVIRAFPEPYQGLVPFIFIVAQER